MNVDELFNMSGSIEDITTEPAKRKIDENLYFINLADAKDSIYRSKVRFLPNFRNVKKSRISKYTYWLTDASGENGISVDDPTSIGEKSPIGDMYWKLKNSVNPVEKNLSEKLKRNRKFYSLVQIIEDVQHPELEGKIMVFGYGIKINDKIEAEFKDLDEGGNPFDLMTGRVFRIESKKVGGYQNYDSCRFVSAGVPIEINGKRMTNSEADKKKIIAYLEDSPELENYEFKPWDASTLDAVNERLKTYKNGSNRSAIVERAITQEEDDEPVYEKSSDEDDDFLDGIDL